MRLAVISFTETGAALCVRLSGLLRQEGISCTGFIPERYEKQFAGQEGILPRRQTAADWTRSQFSSSDGLIFIGAAGIAVRAIAPCLKDKQTDPAVLVIDEAGACVIALLSGHMGGSNRLCRQVAELLKAMPVITTASDVRGQMAVDVWASDHGLLLSDKRTAQQIASQILDGEPVGFSSDYPCLAALPDGLDKQALSPWQVRITPRICREEAAVTLRLIPPVLFVGIGCRKGTKKERILETLRQVMDREQLDIRAIAAIASIDIKQEEPGLLETAAALAVPFRTFSADALNRIPGSFHGSSFVKNTTGTDNVCERAALAAAGNGGRLLINKYVGNGVTAAVAEGVFSLG